MLRLFSSSSDEVTGTITAGPLVLKVFQAGVLLSERFAQFWYMIVPAGFAETQFQP
jgi:hypothetical protein